MRKRFWLSFKEQSSSTQGNTPIDGNAILQAAEQFRKRDGQRQGRLPLPILNALESLSRIDWRTLLHEFLDFEIDDYSFLPPDRRFADADFFLPDFNGVSERMEGVAVLIDVSGSIGDEELSEFFQELLAIINSFRGKVEFYAGLFDVELSGLSKITAMRDIKKIKGQGRGETSLEKPLIQLFGQLKDVDLKAIVVLTDGYLDFLSPKEFHSLPVLWVINNNEITPSHGRIARMTKS